MTQGQALQDKCMEDLCYSPHLLAATQLNAAGLQDILQQPFCPASIDSADPFWHLPQPLVRSCQSPPWWASETSARIETVQLDIDSWPDVTSSPILVMVGFQG